MPDHDPTQSISEAAIVNALASAMGEHFEKLNKRLDRLEASLGVTNGTTKSVVHRVTDLEARVATLEDAG